MKAVRLTGRAACVLALFALGCGGVTSTGTVVSPGSVRCQVTLRSSATTFADAGGAAAIAVNAPRDCQWTASAESGWITVGPATGQGAGNIQAVVARNDQPSRRTARVLVNDAAVQLTQDPAPCVFQIAPSRSTFGAEADEGTLTISTASACSWTATTDASWVALQPPLDGSGDGQVRFSVSQNSGSERTGTIRVGAAEQRIMQEAVARQGGPPAAPDCSFAIAPSAVEAPAPGGSFRSTVTTSTACAWRASTTAGWIDVLTATGNGTGAVRFTVQANAGGVRSATIQVAGHTLRVSQAGSAAPAPEPPPTCSFNLDPSSESLGAEGGEGRVRVTTAENCAWTASSGNAWVTVTSPSSGRGAGEVRYRVSANPGQESRQGSIGIANRTFAIRQAGVPAPPSPTCSFEVEPRDQSFSAEGGDDRIRVRTDASCSWTAASNTAWVEITSGTAGTGNGDVRFRIARNDGAARSGTMTVAGHSVTVAQTAAPVAERVDVEGPVGGLSGTCPRVTFSVRGNPVETNSGTRYRDGSCGSLRNGAAVEVRGEQRAGGPIVATEIRIDDR